MLKKLILAAALLCVTPALADGVRIVVPARDIARGETLSAADVTYQTVPVANAGLGAVSSLDDVVGFETRRVLRAGESLRASDLRHPVLVTKGTMISMSFEAPGITLTTMGRAMSEGGLGETITVQNPNSFRQITAIVTGQGQARAIASQPTQVTASR